MNAEEAAHYRQRARDMRKQAGRALTRALQDSYLAVAADWDRRAKEIEQCEDVEPVPPPAMPRPSAVHPPKE